MEVVNITCTVPGGIRLQVPGREDVIVAGSRREGHSLRDMAGYTPVAADHWRAWLDANGENPVVLSGSIYALPNTEPQ